jgi:hypothetical protein
VDVTFIGSLRVVYWVVAAGVAAGSQAGFADWLDTAFVPHLAQKFASDGN